MPCFGLLGFPEFRVYDNGNNPDDMDDDGDDGTNKAPRQELAVVQYESNVMGSRGPRRMQVSACWGRTTLRQPSGAFLA